MGAGNEITEEKAGQTPPVQVDNVQPAAAQHAVVPVQGYAAAAPPSYQQADAPPANKDVPGVARTDDPARAELGSNYPPPVTVIVTPLQNLHTDPANVKCPFCQQVTYTDVRTTESDTTWLYTILCCLCCGLIGALFPLLLHWGNDFEHFCKNCGNRLARVPHEGGSGQTQVFGPQPGIAVSVPAPAHTKS